jgi:hypothetical protein
MVSNITIAWNSILALTSISWVQRPHGATVKRHPRINKVRALAQPADVTASAFYITNIQNYVIGNAASGGWAGFAFPILHEPIGAHRNLVNIRPSSVTGSDY